MNQFKKTSGTEQRRARRTGRAHMASEFRESGAFLHFIKGVYQRQPDGSLRRVQ